jgi:hypothetical protein
MHRIQARHTGGLFFCSFLTGKTTIISKIIELNQKFYYAYIYKYRIKSHSVHKGSFSTFFIGWVALVFDGVLQSMLRFTIKNTFRLSHSVLTGRWHSLFADLYPSAGSRLFHDGSGAHRRIRGTDNTETHIVVRIARVGVVPIGHLGVVRIIGPIAAP